MTKIYTIEELFAFLGIGAAISVAFAAADVITRDVVLKYFLERRHYKDQIRDEIQLYLFPELAPQKPLFRNALRKSLKEITSEFHIGKKK